MSRNPNAQIRLLGSKFDMNMALGSAPITYSGGAVFEEKTRPQAMSMTVFQGNALLHVEVPILLDGWGVPGDREAQDDRLNRLLALCFGEKGNPPPSFRAYAPTLPFSGTTFKMESLPDLTDEPPRIRGEGGTLFRQSLTLKLLQFIDPADLRFAKQGVGPNGASGPGGTAIGPAQPTGITVLRDGETYFQVAARAYSEPSRATEIAKANGDSSPFQTLAARRHLRLPTS